MRVVLVAAAALISAMPALAQTSDKSVTGPKTLKPWMVACADLPVTTTPSYTSTITGVYTTGDDRHLASPGQELMINRLPNDGLAIGQRFVVRRAQTTFYGFGGRQEGFGRVRTAGVIEIIAIDENNAHARVTFACAPVEVGDYLDTYTEPTLPGTAAQMVDPDFDDRAHVLEGTDGAAMFGDGDTLSVDRGSAHGIVLGQRFSFWRDRRDAMPLFYLAEGVVMHVSEQTSKVVITQAKDAVTTRDVAVIRRQR